MSYLFLVIIILTVTEGENVRITTQCGRRGPHSDGFRIINGTLAAKGEFPWLISLRIREGVKYKPNCGGAIISNSWILTAAHCVFGKKTDNLLVVAGENNVKVEEGTEQYRKVIEVYMHKNFDLATFANDIALLKLASKLEFSTGSYIMPICLPGNHQNFIGNALVAGWGSTERGPPSDLLLFIEMPLIEKSKCDYNYIRSGFSRLLNDCQICAGLPEGGKDACQGDSGGPLACEHDGKFLACGIVSWGIGCGNKNYPGIYTKVSCYIDWIEKITSIHNT